MQREIPILSDEKKEPVMAPVELVRACRHRLDAIVLCVQLSRLSNETICAELGIDEGHFSRMMHGRANFPDSKSDQLMALCRNFAPMQWEAMRFGFVLTKDAKETRKAELLAELEQLERAA